jgi:1-acyl-sn-glycerol-3-phosphate acyltransferase
MPTCARAGTPAVPDAPQPDPLPDPVRERSPAALRAFSLYLRWYFSRNFHTVRITRIGLPADPPNRPIIVCSNHPSWWDPAMYIVLGSTLLPRRIGFGPMDAQALKRYGVLRKMGVFGIDPDTRRGAAAFLQTGLRILADPRCMLFVTAEGAFTDPRTRPVRLRPGIAHLARRVPNAIILPLALEYPFWNERRPEALAHFGPPLDAAAIRTTAEWTATLEDALTRAIDSLAAASMSRNPALFHEILRGQAGIGGVYDVWRHGLALLRGERFDPSHEGRG